MADSANGCAGFEIPGHACEEFRLKLFCTPPGVPVNWHGLARGSDQYAQGVIHPKCRVRPPAVLHIPLSVKLEDHFWVARDR